ncbi:MAG: chemotaxis protein CheW [Bryobacteraceae bacterium]
MTAAAETAAVVAAVAAKTARRQYLTFQLGEECYGIDILRVREIRGYGAVTPVPGAPPFVKGVLNLRGTVIPVIDLRLRLGMPESQESRFRVIVVVNLEPGGGGSKVAGILVDAVSEVAEFGEDELRDPPEFGSLSGTAFVRAIVPAGDRLVVLIDLEPLWTESPGDGGAASKRTEGESCVTGTI